MGGMTGAIGGVLSAVFDCRKGSGVRKDGFTLTRVLPGCTDACGDLTRNDGMLWVCGGSSVLAANGKGVRMGGGGNGMGGGECGNGSIDGIRGKGLGSSA